MTPTLDACRNGGLRAAGLALALALLFPAVSPAQTSVKAKTAAVIPQLRLEHKITYPTRLAIGPKGMVFVTDFKLGSVFILDPKLRPKEELQGLASPLGIAVDRNQRIYIGNKGRGNVEVYSRTGKLLHYLGKPRNEFSMPSEIVVSKDLRVFVADSIENCIKVYDAKGRRTSVIGAKGSKAGQFRFPSTLALSPDGKELYVGDQQNRRVQVLTLAGKFLREFGKVASLGKFEGNFTCIQSIAIAPATKPLTGVAVHVVDTIQNRVQILSSTGRHQKTYGKTGRNQGELNLPLDIAVDSKGRVIACNAGNRRVEVIR